MSDFKNRLYAEWLIPFCAKHGYSDAGFIRESVDKLDPSDAIDFLAAVDDGLVVHDHGVFRAPCSKATEQIFWQGTTKSSPRKVSLWIEPIITMAGLYRLHSQYEWPKDQLGMQSKTWAFDLVAYSKDLKQELVACEVKKSWREIEKLISLMELHKDSPSELVSEVKGAERNASKKIIGLRLSKAPVFWALGPGSRSRVFRVEYGPSEKIRFIPSEENDLSARNHI